MGAEQEAEKKKAENGEKKKEEDKMTTKTVFDKVLGFL
jgi:hypothetical protein